MKPRNSGCVQRDTNCNSNHASSELGFRAGYYNDITLRAVKLVVWSNHLITEQKEVTLLWHNTGEILSLFLLCLPFLCCLSKVYRFGVTSFVSVCASVSIRHTQPYNALQGVYKITTRLVHYLRLIYFFEVLSPSTKRCGSPARTYLKDKLLNICTFLTPGNLKDGVKQDAFCRKEDTWHMFQTSDPISYVVI